VHAIDTVVMPG